MKRALLIGVIGVSLIAMLCMGLVALGLLVTPVRAQISQAVDSALDRAQLAIENRTEPRANPRAQAQETPQAQQDDEPGILIAGVVDGSAADQAGLRRGDILLEVDGTEVNDLAALENALAQQQAGDQVELLVQRGDEQVTLTATLQEAQEGMPRQGHAAVLLGIQPCGEMGMGFGNPENNPFGRRFELQGLRLTQVVANSPAAEAGLKRGDVVISADGQALNQPNRLSDILEGKNPGDSITLEVLTGEETREVTVELGEHPEQEGRAYLGVRYTAMSMPVIPDGPMPWMPEGPDGELPPDHPPFDGLPFPLGDLTSGALIQEVAENSPAAEAGLQAGQVIQAIDGITLESSDALAEAVASHKPGEEVTLTVVDPQSGEKSEVTVTLGENPDRAGAAWLGIRYAFMQINTEDQVLPEG